MGSKNEPGKHDCYANALPDEPMFVLLARDPSAPDLIEQWAHHRLAAIVSNTRPGSDMALVNEARECAANMRTWRELNDGAWRK